MRIVSPILTRPKQMSNKTALCHTIYFSSTSMIFSNQIHRFADNSTLHSRQYSNKLISGTLLSRVSPSISGTANLDAISIRDNLLYFNAAKTQPCIMTNKNSEIFTGNTISGETMYSSPSLSLVRAKFTKNLKWHTSVSYLAKMTSKNLTQILPTIEYCSHIVGATPKVYIYLLCA